MTIQAYSAAEKLAEPQHPSVTPSSVTDGYSVIKRDGNRVPYQDDKIAIAITKAILAVEGQQASGSSRVREKVSAMVADISRRFHKQLPQGHQYRGYSGSGGTGADAQRPACRGPCLCTLS